VTRPDLDQKYDPPTREQLLGEVRGVSLAEDGNSDHGPYVVFRAICGAEGYYCSARFRDPEGYGGGPTPREAMRSLARGLRSLADSVDGAAEPEPSDRPACAGTTSPRQYGFEYEVKLAVSIPLAWAELLKLAAEHHYDYKCRESGKSGVVNALYNTACDGQWPSNHPVTFGDLNLVSKVAEQVRHHTQDQMLALAIRAWLQDTMGALSKQRELCTKLPGSAEAL
jgi:hypothetical protein